MIRRSHHRERIAELEQQVADRDLELGRVQYELDHSKDELTGAHDELRAATIQLAAVTLELEAMQPPELADSAAWTATEPTVVGDTAAPGEVTGELNKAIVRVLAFGNSLRTCAKCGTQATNSFAMEYEWTGDDVRVLVDEKCQSCSAAFSFKVPALAWTCMEAMRAWEGIRTARALFRSQVQTSADLEDLDS